MSDNKKEQIIEAALTRFSHFGYQKTSMSEIADDLRITKANLYYYYPDKGALVKDCAQFVVEEMMEEEKRIVSNYKGNLIKTVLSIYEMHAKYQRKYYMLSLHDQLELIKDLGLDCIHERYECEHKENLELIFQKAVENKEIVLEDTKMAAVSFHEIFEGLSILHKVNDVILGIPNKDNVDLTLESQKRAILFILEGKLIRKQA